MTSLLGIDVGSSSVKVSLLDAGSGRCLASAFSPHDEMAIDAPRQGWAEQDPRLWWEHFCICAGQLRRDQPQAWSAVAAIGISYQMHGLVLVDKQQRVLRPSIIWCDSRAVEVGRALSEKIGSDYCLHHLLNLPGNLTASKLRWVRENEPQIYRQIDKFMLPGDYIAMRLTGEPTTTASGLSEGIFWDFQREDVSQAVLDACEVDRGLIPRLAPTFANQGNLSAESAAELNLRPEVCVAYRAGDQMNNALSLRVLNPGEIAATAGTSGVVYGVIDEPAYDPLCRVNTFMHVSHLPEAPRLGVLMCLNGAGSLNRWLRQEVCAGLSYEEMNRLADDSPVGSRGVMILPFGNGAERVLENRDPGASISNINFNVHTRGDMVRAAHEGVAFALRQGIDVMRGMGMKVHTVRAGKANMFLSRVFAQTLASVAGARIELYSTDGSIGAARGAGIGAGVYGEMQDAYDGLQCLEAIEPDALPSGECEAAYQRWLALLAQRMPQNESAAFSQV